MDDHETKHDEKLNNHKYYYYYEFLKRTVQFVFSVSVFSFFVWYSSGFWILPQSFNIYFSTCLLSMLAHTLERKYMFLICNLILAFLILAKTSLTSPFDDLDQSQQSNEYDPSEEVVFPLPCFQFPEKASPIAVELEEQVKTQQEEFHERVSEELAEGEDQYGTLFSKTEGGENEAPSIAAAAAEEEEEEYDDEEGESGSGVMVMPDDDDDDDEIADNKRMATNELEMVNTEELNRKFEEFIRKMKEEIRIEAQIQPIAV